MKNRYAAALAVTLYTVSAGSAWAKMPDQDYTSDEQTLCQPDVFRVCNDAVPDEDRIIACMKANRSQLSPECRKVFDAGLKKHRR